MQSQSEEVCVELTAFQQVNGPEHPQSLSTASSSGTGAMTPGNGECDFRHPVGVLKRAKTYLYNNWQHLERLLLAVVIVIILMLLLLPTIFYHLPLPPVIRYTYIVENICILQKVMGGDESISNTYSDLHF